MTESSQAAIAHVQAAEQRAREIPGLSPDIAPRPIARVGIVGAGTMGGGIAMNFANAGIPVVVVDATDQGLERGLSLVRRNYQASAARGRLTAQDVEDRMGLLLGTLDYAELGDCDLIIEAVFEDMALKLDVCARVGAVAKPGAILATNTSTLDVDVLAQATGRAADVVGLHFFSPANIMRLLEVVRGRQTAPDVLATVVAMALQIGKTPVVSGVCYGFIGNRMAEVYMRETEFLLLEGASPAQIDVAVQALGLAMGPCRMLDMAGIDVGAMTVIEWKKSGGAPSDTSYRVVVDELFRLGRYGQKTGSGYYRYDGRTPMPDPELDKIVEYLAKRHRIIRRANIADTEIIERLLYSIVNEGCKILEEGISYSPGDIDVVWTAGYGFPKELGGPMYWGERVGLANIANRLRHYAQLHTNADWTPSALLAKAAAGSRGLAEALAQECGA